MSIGIGLCVNQTRAVFEALFGRETEFVRTPKHGIRGKLESWSSKKYRAAKSITPFIELGMAAYFVVAMGVAIDHGHYLSMPVPGAVPGRLRLRRLAVAVAGGLRHLDAQAPRAPRDDDRRGSAARPTRSSTGCPPTFCPGELVMQDAEPRRTSALS